MRSTVLTALIGLPLLLATTTPALARPNPKLGAYAQQRVRTGDGRFAPARPFAAKGFGNPSMTGQGQVFVDVQPATRTRSGSVTVTMPEFYRGSSWQGGASARPLFFQDGKQTVALPATLTVKQGSRYTSFSPAKLEATIPAGTAVTRAGLAQALRTVYVNPLSLKFAPPATKR